MFHPTERVIYLTKHYIEISHFHLILQLPLSLLYLFIYFTLQPCGQWRFRKPFSSKRPLWAKNRFWKRQACLYTHNLYNGCIFGEFQYTIDLKCNTLQFESMNYFVSTLARVMHLEKIFPYRHKVTQCNLYASPDSFCTYRL